MTLRDSISTARKTGPQPQADGAHAFEFNFSADEPTFAGHFPNRPILPGIFQLEIIRLSAEWILNCKLSVQEIAKAKFQRPILPGEILKLNLKLSEVENVISARGNFVGGGQPAGEAFLKLCRNE
jgi:3-hydroxyacyl-[acyl-carrier-protein] dehydratase